MPATGGGPARRCPVKGGLGTWASCFVSTEELGVADAAFGAKVHQYCLTGAPSDTVEPFMTRRHDPNRFPGIREVPCRFGVDPERLGSRIMPRCPGGTTDSKLKEQPATDVVVWDPTSQKIRVVRSCARTLSTVAGSIRGSELKQPANSPAAAILRK